MNVKSHHTLTQLQTLYRTETNKRLALRIQGVYLARMGRTCPQIMAVTDRSRRTIQQWTAKYNRGRLEALFEKPRTGQPTKLPRNREKEFRRRIESGPTQKDGFAIFNGTAIRHILKQEFGQIYSLNGVLDLLHRLGYSIPVPLPKSQQFQSSCKVKF